MGSEVVRAVCAESDLILVAAVDPRGEGQDAAAFAGLPASGVVIRPNLIDALAETRPDVAIDFTEPDAAFANALAVVAAGSRPVIGTTGIPSDGIRQLAQAITETGLSGLVAPNFAIGAVLLMKFAAAAAKYLPHCEIIELHHDGKKDAPSGTALYTARLIAAAKRTGAPVAAVQEQILIPGARGCISDGVPIHSVRLPGYVASQEVIFGGPGQTLSLRHDTIDRKCFMPGIVMATRRIVDLQGFYLGLESILDV
jgi:4-hydroxy-tetrahydrodipicolinate reductase